MYVFLLCSDLDTLQSIVRFRNAVQKEENNQRSAAAVNPVWWYFSLSGQNYLMCRLMTPLYLLKQIIIHPFFTLP